MSHYERCMEKIVKHQTEAPVKVIPIAHDLGIKVYNVSYSSDNISGNILYNEDYGGDSGYAIYVNNLHRYNRRRFTIAHEIAHYVLHKDRVGDGIYDDVMWRSGLSSKYEAQANDLAADILMPLELLNRDIQNNMYDTRDLAEKYEVSREAMAIRMKIPR